jgi:hypothetical protein
MQLCNLTSAIPGESRPLTETIDIPPRERALAFHWGLQNRNIFTPLCLHPPRSRDGEIAQEQIMLNAIFANQVDGAGVRYSRRRANYVGLRRYFGSAYTFTNVVRTVDGLVRQGWLENWTAPACPHGAVQSVFRAAPELIFAIAMDDLRGVECRPLESVRLRDANRCLIDYRDTVQTSRMRRAMAEINEALRSSHLALHAEDITRHGPILRVGAVAVNSARSALYRVFNMDWHHGGSSVAGGGRGFQRRCEHR